MKQTGLSFASPGSKSIILQKRMSTKLRTHTYTRQSQPQREHEVVYESSGVDFATGVNDTNERASQEWRVQQQNAKEELANMRDS